MDWASIDEEHARSSGPVAAGGNLEREYVHSAYATACFRLSLQTTKNSRIAFGEVTRACRTHHPTTWITPEMIDLYETLHGLDLAHSVEVWDGDELVGGTFGILIGGVFSIESMFHHVTGASKVAVADLARRLVASGILIIDCQDLTPYLAMFGVVDVPRASYLEMLRGCRDMRVALFSEPMQLSDWQSSAK